VPSCTVDASIVDCVVSIDVRVSAGGRVGYTRIVKGVGKLESLRRPASHSIGWTRRMDVLGAFLREVSSQVEELQRPAR
jgi:hypothetical protein